MQFVFRIDKTILPQGRSGEYHQICYRCILHHISPWPREGAGSVESLQPPFSNSPPQDFAVITSQHCASWNPTDLAGPPMVHRQPSSEKHWCSLSSKQQNLGSI